MPALKSWAYGAIGTLLLAGCVVSRPAAVADRVNPASAYCLAQGGRLQIVRDHAGAEQGWCYLPNGRVLEEWALYRQQWPDRPVRLH